MFWRKQSDGFEWHKYVRTTIKLRRDDRRRRIEEVKHAAAQGLRDAGRAGAAAGASGLALLGVAAAAGAKGSLSGARSLALHTASALSVFVQFMAGVVDFALGLVGTGVRRTAALLGIALRPASRPLTRTGVQPVLLLIAGVTALSATVGLATAGLTPETLIALAVAGAALTLALLPVLLGEQVLPPTAARLVQGLSGLLPSIPPRARLVLRVATVVIVCGAGFWMLSRSPSRMTQLPSLYGAGSPALEGRGYALSGDTLRVSDTVVRLSGVEAPDREQRCTRGGSRRWKCGEAAQEALARVLRSGVLKCQPRGTYDAGRTLATCYVSDKDVAAALVREGYLFSSGGLLSGYGSEEREAKSERAGMWQGEVERPAEYRAKLWEAAKRAAPDECPIKGQVSSGEKRYLLPWSPNYDKVQIRPTRGERWFCSEQEALAAGWKPVERS
jgi:endonuclease YncB( thermonuclease family)